VPAPLKLLVELLQLRLQPRSHRLPQHPEPPHPGLPADMRESQEIEALGFPLAAPLSVVGGEPPELDEPRLLGMQRQAESGKALAQLCQKFFGLTPMLESYDEVIGIPNDDDVVRVSLSPPLDPEVEHVVKVDVGQ